MSILRRFILGTPTSLAGNQSTVCEYKNMYVSSAKLSPVQFKRNRNIYILSSYFKITKLYFFCSDPKRQKREEGAFGELAQLVEFF